MTNLERFFSKMDRADGCWLWRGQIDPGGYGRFFLKGKTLRAHRIAYQLFVGPIPDGLQIDHLCRVRNCVNPAHLEVVTHRENCLRGEGAPARNARKTHCKQGHPLSGENLRYVAATNRRDCRACQREIDRKRPNRRTSH